MTYAISYDQKLHGKTRRILKSGARVVVVGGAQGFEVYSDNGKLRLLGMTTDAKLARQIRIDDLER